MKFFFPSLVLLFSVVLLTSCSSEAPEAPESSDVSSSPLIVSQTTAEEVDGVLVEEVSYYKDLPAAVGYLARPKTVGPHPAVILIHEWWGMNDNIRENARKYAQEGYVALAVDMYSGETAQTLDEARELAKKVASHIPQALTNLRNAVSFLNSYPQVDQDRLALVGWSFPGRWAYELAKNELGLKLSVIYYGFFNPEDKLKFMKDDILSAFDEDDVIVSLDDEEVFQARLISSSGTYELYLMKNISNFSSDQNKDSFQIESDEKAWKRTQDFLGEYL